MFAEHSRPSNTTSGRTIRPWLSLMGAENTANLMEDFTSAGRGNGKNPGGMVRAFCKKHRICVSCRHRWTERGTTRCGRCNRVHAQYQKSLLRRNYERDVKAGICVRCHKRPATPTNKRCQKCQDRHASQKRLSKRGSLPRSPQPVGEGKGS
jgi:hypothetical protein